MDVRVSSDDNPCIVWNTCLPNTTDIILSSGFTFLELKCNLILERTQSGRDGLMYFYLRPCGTSSVASERFIVTTCVVKINREMSCIKTLHIWIQPCPIKTVVSLFSFGEIEKEFGTVASKDKITFVFTFLRGNLVTLDEPSRKDGIWASTAPASNRNRVQAPSENPCLEALSQDFGRLLEAESDHDVVLKCGDRPVGAHKIVLASRSKVFQNMLQSDMVEGRNGQVEVKDMDADVFQDFVKYLYTGTLPELTEDKAKGLYEAGDRYVVASLMSRCSVFLSETLTVQNACERLALADAHSDPEFKERAIAFILEKKVPLMDHWIAFSTRCPLVSVQVLNRFCKLHITA